MSERLNHEELKKIALGLFSQQIFTSVHVASKDFHLLPSIFMPLFLITDEDRLKLKEQDAYIFYEYLDKASNRSINGYPIFMSFQWMTKTDWDETLAILEKLGEAAAAI